MATSSSRGSRASLLLVSESASHDDAEPDPEAEHAAYPKARDAARPTSLDVRRQRNRESMRRARVRLCEQKSEMQQQIWRLEAQLATLIAAAEAQHSASVAFGQLVLQTERLRSQKRQLEETLRQFEGFRAKLGAETQQELGVAATGETRPGAWSKS
ncbi:hypothetical protein PHYPSEUDO_002013 [Phytophthora pseudosyringae]|uniref:BZIP domain-containing protein n=1 Tax=Phytophthora pseudosyringae TaxID=221518 RepID=A0A8T1VUV0_9STRA|nr:hypothetical protein PHYPSEUDO_002013 [Phytophthora pseudosyringae]